MDRRRFNRTNGRDHHFFESARSSPIGIAAVLSLSQLADQGASREDLEKAALLLKKSRPTAVNLSIYIERIVAAMQATADIHAAVLHTAEEIYHEDTALCQLMGEAGAALIQEGENILTVCNTGSLATAGIGTALGVIKTAHAQGKKIHVYACETRPLLQGGRLTAWELQESGIPYTLICDNMAATLMQQGKIDRVLVGADRIAANGDFANKIGTYSAAVLAHHHGIPFHVVAPYTTIDPNCPNGHSIQIEERSSEEVRGAMGSFGKVCWSPKKRSGLQSRFRCNARISCHELYFRSRQSLIRNILTAIIYVQHWKFFYAIMSF